MFNILRSSFVRTGLNLTRKNISLNNPSLYALSRAHFSVGQESKVAEQKIENPADEALNKAEEVQTEQQQTKEQAPKKPTFREYLSDKAPMLGKVTDFVVDSWEQTFPSDQYKAKAELARQKAKQQAEIEKNKKVYTEEELEQIQGDIPEWKRTSMINYDGSIDQDPESISTRVGRKIKDKFNQTTVAKKLYETEKYKDYEEFKKEMSQFKEDLKDHLSEHQNPAVIASMHIYGKATSESSTAQAIKEMRKYQRDFDVFDLERDVRGIFVDAYNAYLASDTNYLSKVCEEAGLAYFKTMIKKREIEGVYPKFTEIWESEPADFVAGRISERNLPAFSFTLRIQEIHCNVSKKTGKIVDGAEDRVSQNRFNIVLSLAENPDLETVGHKWVITEVIPVEAVLMLA